MAIAKKAISDALVILARAISARLLREFLAEDT